MAQRLQVRDGPALNRTRSRRSVSPGADIAREEADGRVGTAAQPGIPRSLAGQLRGMHCAGPRCYLPSPGRREDSGAGVVYYTFTVMDLHQL